MPRPFNIDELHRSYVGPTHTIKVVSRDQAAGYLFQAKVWSNFLPRLADLYGRKLTFINDSVLMVAFALGCVFAQGGRAHHVPDRLLTVFAIVRDKITLDVLRACRSGTPRQSQLKRRVDWLDTLLLLTAGLTFVVFVLSDGRLASTCKPSSSSFWNASSLTNVHSSLDPDDASRQWWWTPQAALMLVSIWMRARGKLAAMLNIVFFEWCSLNPLTFWIQLYYQTYQGLAPDPDDGAAPAHSSYPQPPTGPSTAVVISVFGTDFVFATMLLVAKVCLLYERSVGGMLFKTLTQRHCVPPPSRRTHVFSRSRHKTLDLNAGGHVLFLTPHSLCYFDLHSDDVDPFIGARFQIVSFCSLLPL
ncbi:hypothetical protein C8Q74DRAFT_1367132 [Fomes fomentarius]|nr:hypothetical protein C8Q74DRAFT_1367132 [Fomes fomentarius]